MPCLILLTHEEVGTSLLNTARAIIGTDIKDVTCIEVPMDTDPDSIIEQAQQRIDKHSDTLVITDLYGSTPGNIAMQLAQQDNCFTVCGLNLPMLLRAINYQASPIAELIDKVIEGGKLGISSCEDKHDD
jgi:PTS system ascorbate-specific IIA component